MRRVDPGTAGRSGTWSATTVGVKGGAGGQPIKFIMALHAHLASQRQTCTKEVVERKEKEREKEDLGKDQKEKE